MAPAGYFVDAELLVLLVAGSLDRNVSATMLATMK